MRIFGKLSVYLCFIVLEWTSAATPAVPPAPRMRLKGPGKHVDGVSHGPAKGELPSAETLNDRFNTLYASLQGNRDKPGLLVRNLVEFSLQQLEAYRGILSDTAAYANIRMRFANNTYQLLVDVVGNFKTGLRNTMHMLAKGENPADMKALKNGDPETTLQLKLLYADGCPAYRQERLMVTNERIRCVVDTRDALVERFLVAFPLVKRMADVIDAIHDGFTKNDVEAFQRVVHGAPWRIRIRDIDGTE